MNQAAVLSILVKAQGASAAASEIMTVDAAGKKASASADKLEKASVRSSKGYETLSTAAKFGGLAVAGAGAAALNAAGDFEKSLNVFQSVSGATGKQMADVSRLAKQLGADVKLPGTSAQDAAEAMTEMKKAGLSLGDTMGGVRSVLVLSAAAGIENAQAAEIASNALNTFGLKGKDVAMVADQLANTANASSVEITDVADAMKMAGAVFSAFQGPVRGAKGAMTDLNVAIGLLGNAGIKGSDAGTSLKQAMLQLSGPAQKTKNLMRDLYLATDGSAKAQELFRQSVEGSTKEIREKASAALEKLQGSAKGAGDIAYTAAGKMRSLPEILSQVTRATKDMTQEQRQAAITQIFGADATRSILVLMKAGPKAWDSMSTAVTKQGAAQDLAAAKMKGFKGSLEAFKSTLETLAISFGTVLLPAATKAMGFLSGQFGKFEEHKTAVLVMVAAIGTLSVTILTVNAATKAWAAAQTIATVATKAWEGAQWLLNAALTANPIVLVIAGLVALGAALFIAYKKSETFRDIVNGAWNAIKSVAGPVISWLVGAVTDAWNAIKTATMSVWGWIGPYVQFGLDVIKTALTIYFKIYWTIIKTAWDVVKTVTMTLWEWFGPFLKIAFEVIKTAIIVYFQIYKAAITAVWTAIKVATTTLWDWFGPYVKAAWDRLKTAADVAWGLIKFAIINPLKTAKTEISGIWDDLKDAADKGWEKIKSGAGTFATGLKDTISGAFRDAANLVVGFVNKIIDVVNKIPGVDVKKIQLATGGINPADRTAGGHFARGGAFARTGGFVNSPITLMGEEAPRYPEYVIPTNPAYRKRAQGLAMQAAGAVGLAQGGVWSKSELQSLWARVNPGLGDSNLMAAIALAESSGNQNARNPSGASGLWQILGLPFPGNPFDPETNARMAGSKLRSQGLGAWEVYTSGAYKQFLGGGGGIIGKIGDALGGALDLLKDGAKALLGKLPSADDLGWLSGLGRYAIGKVTDWIKDKAGGLLSGSSLGGLTANGKLQLPATFAATHQTSGLSGYPAIDVFGAPGTFVLSPAAGKISRFSGGPDSYTGPGGPFGYSMYLDSAGGQYFLTHFGARSVRVGQSVKYGQELGRIGDYPGSVPDHIHEGLRAMAKGGILGSYATGTPFVPQTGAYMLHRGEAVIPSAFAQGGVNKGTGTTLKIPDLTKMSPLDRLKYIQAAQALQDTLYAPVHKGNTGPVPVSVVDAPAVVVPEPPPAPDNQALIDALNELVRLEGIRIDLTNQQLSDTRRALNVSQSQYGVLAQAITDVANGGIGQRLGLGLSGLRAPAGSVARI